MENDKPIVADFNDPDWDDNPEWTDQDFARARPASEFHPPEVLALLVRPAGRPVLVDLMVFWPYPPRLSSTIRAPGLLAGGESV